MRAWMLVVVLPGLVALAGCLDDADEGPLGLDSGEVPVLETGVVLGFEASCPTPTPAPGPAPAAAALCMTWTFHNQVPAGKGGWLDVLVAWDGAKTAGFQVEVDGPSAAWEVERGFDSLRVRMWGPEPGLFRVSLYGAGDAEGSVRALHPLSHRGDADWRLPDLVTLVPSEVHVGACSYDESMEDGAERCLRLGNGIGNIGDGPMEVHLSIPDGALAATGLGRFTQRLYHTDGSYEDAPVSGAAFHFTHAHFHYEGVAQFRLFRYDPDTGLRGDEVGTGHKSGFCLLDIGQMQEPDVESETDGGWRSDQACLIPDVPSGWSMGISKGWYDLYWSSLPDQYVEISGVPDGVYELVSVADGDGTLTELDTGNNAASVVLRLQGDDVEVLEERGFYHLPA